MNRCPDPVAIAARDWPGFHRAGQLASYPLRTRLEADGFPGVPTRDATARNFTPLRLLIAAITEISFFFHFETGFEGDCDPAVDNYL